ncbi:MAG TPA: FAD binding domain-containing protein [Stellaceae bacterium]|jgi:carbon-monoxide dehydrogenase medium subunit|nr:FAD binding domain-containing protein [Stellaceae bacterium]
MKPSPFVYHAPREIAEATELLAQLGDDGRVLAGGQSLVPMMAFRVANPAHLIDINGIAALDHLGASDSELVVGALTRHAAFHRPVVAGQLGELLTAVVHHIAHWPIRTRGTMCGSLAHADPASEWCLVVATLDATIVVQSAAGQRAIPAADYFHGIMTTAVADGEMVVKVRLPLLGDDYRCGFYEFSRRAGDFAIAMSLTALRLADGRIVEARIGLGGVEAQPRRIAAAEDLLRGEAPCDAVFRAAAEAAAAAADPLEDLQADAAYRQDLTRVVVRRALERAMGETVA